MHEHLTAAGFIVHDNEAIYAIGATSDEAWSAFVREMAESPGIVILGENEDTSDLPDIPDEPCNWMRESDFHIRAATAALLAMVEERGGNIAWDARRGIACTVEEGEGE
jgi:hypothetical protein